MLLRLCDLLDVWCFGSLFLAGCLILPRREAEHLDDYVREALPRRSRAA